MTLADKMGLGPKRELVVNPDGSGAVYVKPPAWVGEYPVRKVELTAEQVAGYHAWKAGEYIQVALASLSAADREVVLNGGVEV